MTRFEHYINEAIKFDKDSAFASNTKTKVSIDFTTDCPKRRAGNPCKYCYVEYKRSINFNAKKVYDYRNYKGELKNKKIFTPEVIKELNDMGGIRLFSFGDYMPEHDKDIKEMLDDAKDVGLDVKVITKAPEFIYKFHDHPAIKVINISIDMLPNNTAVDHNLAKELRSKYKKVVIRGVILNPSDLEHEFLKDVDIITFNHERLGKLGYKRWTKKMVEQYYKEHPDLGICCITGKCNTCPIKCGKRKYSQTCLM